MAAAAYDLARFHSDAWTPQLFTAAASTDRSVQPGAAARGDRRLVALLACPLHLPRAQERM